jgi:centromere-localized protein 2
VLPQLETATHDLAAEIQQLREEEQRLLHEITQTVGSLSDLRYGRFSNSKLRDQVMEGLDNFQDTCRK